MHYPMIDVMLQDETPALIAVQHITSMYEYHVESDEQTIANPDGSRTIIPAKDYHCTIVHIATGGAYHVLHTMAEIRTRIDQACAAWAQPYQGRN